MRLKKPRLATKDDNQPYRRDNEYGRVRLRFDRQKGARHDYIEGERFKLTHHDSQADGKHHFLPLSAVASVGEFVTSSMTAAEAESQWEEEQ